MKRVKQAAGTLEKSNQLSNLKVHKMNGKQNSMKKKKKKLKQFNEVE